MVLVKDYALDDRGGGQALPPFLQGRVPTAAGAFASRPMITPKSTIAPGEVARSPINVAQKQMFGAKKPGVMAALKALKKSTIKPAITPMKPAITPAQSAQIGPTAPGQPAITPAQPQVGPTTPGQPAIASTNKPQGSTAQTLYDFFKRDLEGQRKSAMSGAVADAARRGVYYGTPLTTSQGDIETEYLRGLGQLQSGILQNEQQNELSRLGIAANLIGPFQEAQAAGVDPEVFKTIGGLVGGGQPAAQAPTAPQITPAANPAQPAPFQPQLPFRPGQQSSFPLRPFRPAIPPDGTFSNGIDPTGRPWH